MAGIVSTMHPLHQQQGTGNPGKSLGQATANGLLESGSGNGDEREHIFLRSVRDFASTGSTNNNTEQLARRLGTSVVVNAERNISPDVPSPTSDDDYRLDYTDEVKRKYFEQQETSERDNNLLFSAFPPPIEGSDSNNNSSNDEGIPSRIFSNASYVPSSNQSSLSSGGAGVISNDKTTKMLHNNGGGNRSSPVKALRPHTPPLTLYSSNKNEGIPPATLLSRGFSETPDNNDDNSPDTDESAGHLSPGPDMNGSSSDTLVVITTPTSQALTATPNLNSISDYTPHGFSPSSAASSRGSMSTTNNPLLKQPVLYSAIGSLEHANCNSLTNLNKRFLAPSKEFCKPRGAAPATAHSVLIPPARHYQPELRTPSNSALLQGGIPTTTEQGPDLQLYQQQNTRSTTSSRPSATHNVLNQSKSRREKTEKNSQNKNSEDTSASIRPSKTSDNPYKKERSSRLEATSTDPPSNDKNKIKNKNKTNTNFENSNSSIRDTRNNKPRRSKSKKKVSYDASARTRKSKSKTIEMFRPSSDAYTPRIERKKIKYKAAEARPSVQHMSSTMGTLSRPNFRDALRRVAMIIHQHIVKIESRFEQKGQQPRGSYGTSATRMKAATDDGLFHASMREMFHEDAYRTPTYKCNMARIPMARPGMVYGLRKIKVMYEIPSETEIYDFGHQLFNSVQLSSECSIVCLIYVERLMEVAKVPLLACTWRPIFMCGLLLASKVWQDLSSWNIEFSSVYPQFSLESINKLELNFLRNVKWDLYISSSSYAKYYFALRSLVEKQGFRQRYNRMVGGVGNVAQAEALKVQERTEIIKEEALLQFSRSM